MDKLKTIVDIIPLCMFQGISIAIVCLSIGGSIAIGKADDVEVSKESIRVERQASKNQDELENALEVIDAYENSLQTVEYKVKQLGKKDKRAREIVEDIELVEQVIPQSKVDRIEDTIKQSKEVLHDEQPGYRVRDLPN